MLRHKNIERVCCCILALTLLLSGLFIGAAAKGAIAGGAAMGYETRLFDQSRVHTIDIVMNDWDAFLETATAEEYAACHLVIDGESYKNVAIRGKGNTSLSTVRSYGNNRYSFKVEFDHYQTGATYHGLDKLSLNNLIQDNTYMKDYMAYTLMNKAGVSAPLCSFVQVRVNGQPWGLYLAVEAVEDSFLQRNWGKDHGDLYKPDSVSFGGGRGNGRNFDMDAVKENFGFSFDQFADAMPGMGAFPQMSAENGMPDMSAVPQMPNNSETPDATIVPQAEGDTSAAAAGRTGANNSLFSPTDRTEGFKNFGGNARGFGMGSSDVKLIYTDDDPASYANIFNNAKTNVTGADQARLIAALKALGQGDTAAVDTDAVIRYMAVHNFLCNDDSYTGTMIHNYYLYEENGVLTMIPWDYNLAFGNFQGGSNASGIINRSITSLVSGGGDRPMADWITNSEEYTAQYLAVYEAFIENVFHSGWFAAEIDRVTALIAPYVENDPTALCTYAEFQAGAETLRQFCLKRAESVTRQLHGETATVDATGINLSAMGSMGRGMGGGAFSRGGNLAHQNPFTGSGSAAESETMGTATDSASGAPSAEARRTNPNPGSPSGAAAWPGPGSQPETEAPRTAGSMPSLAQFQHTKPGDGSPSGAAPAAESETMGTATDSASGAPPAEARRTNPNPGSPSGAAAWPGPGTHQTQTSSQGAWLMLALCVALLLGAVLLVCLYPAKR